VHAASSFRTALARLRHVAGFPSGLVVSFFFSFYLLVNAITYVGSLAGLWGVLLPVLASTGITAFLVVRWQHSLDRALSASRLDEQDPARLAERRGVVVLVGLDSSNPGTTFLRLVTEATSCEYLALVTTAQDDELGVTRQLIERVLPLSGRRFAEGHVRIWGGNNAESLSDAERAVEEALAWLARHGVHPSSMVVDVTKGRRSMEFGALIAADRARVEVQYLAADWHHLDNRPRPGTQGFFVVRTLWDTVGTDAVSLNQ
jgi:hypothetical protein